LDSFVGEVFSSLVRKDRRSTAGLYVRGLMRDGRRKSMQPMPAATSSAVLEKPKRVLMALTMGSPHGLAMTTLS
jgi:hypothetical protein